MNKRIFSAKRSYHPTKNHQCMQSFTNQLTHSSFFQSFFVVKINMSMSMRFKNDISYSLITLHFIVYRNLYLVYICFSLAFNFLVENFVTKDTKYTKQQQTYHSKVFPFRFYDNRCDDVTIPFCIRHTQTHTAVPKKIHLQIQKKNSYI